MMTKFDKKVTYYFGAEQFGVVHMGLGTSDATIHGPYPSIGKGLEALAKLCADDGCSAGHKLVALTEISARKPRKASRSVKVALSVRANGKGGATVRARKVA